MIRESCLWDILSNNTRSSAKWWQYKLDFMNGCHTNGTPGSYDEGCSESMVRGVKVSDKEFTEWKHCWEPYRTNPNKTIASAQHELDEMGRERVSWFMKTTLQVNGRHVRGLYDAVRPTLMHALFRAACPPTCLFCSICAACLCGAARDVLLPAAPSPLSCEAPSP
jgi:hypothetical protein